MMQLSQGNTIFPARQEQAHLLIGQQLFYSRLSVYGKEAHPSNQHACFGVVIGTNHAGWM